MNTRQALAEMDRMATEQGFAITQGPVYGLYSSRMENGVKVQSVTRTYERDRGPGFDFSGDKLRVHIFRPEKLTLSYDAATDVIY